MFDLSFDFTSNKNVENEVKIGPLDQKTPLKPKHHYLLHYPRVMMKMGPLRYVSAIRFEAKHREIKQNAKIVTSRRNPSYTLALKQQLALTHRFVAIRVLRIVCP